ncbi:MAG TPA: ABC transporter substrate-binding protein [Reyranella sp.]|jgi:putative ABC transport system substrate-binding protein
MKRRVLLAALSAWPAVARAQSMPRVGFLHPGKVDPSNMRLATFADGLRSKGYADGKTVSIVVRAAAFDPNRVAQYAAELIDSKVDVLFAVGSKVIREARQRTSTIPIVALDLESDPVASGFVKSLAQPGGNVTGLFFDFAEFSGKWLEIMGEIVPGLKRAGVIWDPATGKVQIDAATTVARQRGVALDVIECAAPAAIEQGFQQAADRKVQVVLVLSSPVFGTVPQLVSSAALKHRLPTITMFPEFAEMGGLVAYGTDQRDLFRQSGEIVGRVLAGTRPADLPVERPTRILLAVNMKTAAALGLTIPQVVLLRADQVIE